MLLENKCGFADIQTRIQSSVLTLPFCVNLSWTEGLGRATRNVSFKICIFNKYVNWYLCHFYFNTVHQELSIEEPLNLKLTEQLSSIPWGIQTQTVSA